MTQIGMEESASSSYDIELNSNKRPVLSLKNVAIVESMIRNDSSYRDSTNVDKKPEFFSKDVKSKKTGVLLHRKGDIRYGGSTAYWASKLYLMLIEKTPLALALDKAVADSAKALGYGSNYEKTVIFCLVSSIDRENSTHLNASVDGRKQMTSWIMDYYSNGTLLNEIQSPKKCCYRLIEKLSTGITAVRSGTKKRQNFSFATKFCHYTSYYLFEGTPEQDNFSIYDNVMEKAIKKYNPLLKKVSFFCKYEEYIDAIDKIRIGSISRNGFDHLLWYYYKGRN